MRGRSNLPMFWAYLGVYLVSMVVGMFIVDPTLIQERMRPGPGGQDFATLIVLTPLMLAQCVIAAIDVGRYHWSDSVPVVHANHGTHCDGRHMAVLLWAESVNRFFSSVIRIQTERGHHVITTGPYRYLRHPGYAASPFLLIGGGLVLGSWLAALIGVVMCLPIFRRTARRPDPPGTARGLRRIRPDGAVPSVPGSLVNER